MMPLAGHVSPRCLHNGTNDDAISEPVEMPLFICKASSWSEQMFWSISLVQARLLGQSQWANSTASHA